jgi:hypothetical protein
LGIKQRVKKVFIVRKLRTFKKDKNLKKEGEILVKFGI